MKRTFPLLCALILQPAVGAQTTDQPPPSAADMWRIIQQQQREIQALRRELATVRQTPAPAVEAEAEAEAAAPETPVSATHIGGYGELHYNNLDGSGGASDRKQIDLHRFVLYFGHDFDDRLRFQSELELEHAFAADTADGSAPGEVELEQAYVEYDLRDDLSARAGLFLVPVGILNETHEPPTFYGVERNPVEQAIIPSTWWEAGVALTGRWGDGFGYDLALHSGLDTSAAAGYAVRAGRQNGAKAQADDPAVTARLRWHGLPGIELAGTLQYQADITQGRDPLAGSATLAEIQGVFQHGPWGLKALYARWHLQGSGPAAIGADDQNGFYLEPSYRIGPRLGLFARYNRWDNQAGSNSGTARDSTRVQWNLGLDWWLHPDVVLKADYQKQDNDDGANRDGINLGIGYQF